jgi:hypothetical protein
VDRASIGSAFDQISKKCLGEILCIVLCDPADVAGTHKLVSINLAKAPTMHSARAAMLFANRPPGAQLSSGWKQRSYPALWSAMLRALQVFYSDD